MAKSAAHRGIITDSDPNKKRRRGTPEKRLVSVSVRVFLFFLCFFSQILLHYPANSTSDALEQKQPAPRLPTNYVTSFYQLAHEPRNSGHIDQTLNEFVSGLEEEEQLFLYRILLNDPNPRFYSFGIAKLIDIGRIDISMDKLTQLYVSGNNLSTFYWHISNLENKAISAQVLTELQRSVLEHFSRKSEPERGSVNSIADPVEKSAREYENVE